MAKQRLVERGAKVIHVDDYDDVWTFYVDTNPRLMSDPVFRHGCAFKAMAHDYFGRSYMISWGLDHLPGRNQDDKELVDDWSVCDYFEVM